MSERSIMAGRSAHVRAVVEPVGLVPAGEWHEGRRATWDQWRYRLTCGHEETSPRPDARYLGCHTCQGDG